MKSSGSASCGACKFLRRKCTNECVFAPHFCYDEAANHFAKVHRVFGASNASKLLLHLPVHKRSDAATTIAYEAIARMHDPIYGCVSHIFALQQQVACLQQEIYILSNHMADQAFQEHNSGSFEATSDPIVGLEFISQPSYNNMDERPSQMLFDEGVISDNQELCSQMDDKVPNLYGCEEQLYNVPSDIDLSESLFGGTSQEMFVPYIWMSSSSCNNLQ